MTVPAVIGTVEQGEAPLPPALVLSDELASAIASADAYAQGATAERTRKEYAAGFRLFEAWCVKHGARALPAHPEAVRAYLAGLADRGLKPATIDARAAAIAYRHRDAGLDSPTGAPGVRATIRGIRNRVGVKPNKKAPATADHVRRMLKKIPDTLTGKRDAALLALGFAGALRRSELVALDVEHVERTPEGMVLHILRSKTDQEGAGHQVPVLSGTKLRPVKLLEVWLAAAGIRSGPLFRQIRKGGHLTGERLKAPAVAMIVKERAEEAGLDPRFFAGHSLRSGFVTSALANGADTLKVMSITRHQNVNTLKEYDGRAQAFKDHAGKGFL
jgi:site-specific recombinase XerD